MFSLLKARGRPGSSWASQELGASPDSAQQAALLGRCREPGPALKARDRADGRDPCVWRRRRRPRRAGSCGVVPVGSARAIRAESLGDVTQWASEEFDFITILDLAVPVAPRREIHQGPPFLFAAGELRSEDPAVSVVGSRRASERGLSMARSIAHALVDRGISVIAGLALGNPDPQRTRPRLRRGRTVALIATGIRRQYPPDNQELHLRIAASGLLLSQFWPDAPPQKQNSPDAERDHVRLRTSDCRSRG